jgi:formylglycine-generating enzyme required for sulfatase activity
MDIEMKYAWVPPGAFLMGSKAPDIEKPVHRVRITRGFHIGIYPVTQAQWQAVMGYNPSHFRGDDRPVEQVSWDDCQEFCGRLGQLTGKSFRLPTEAEWEYACRAGTTSHYCNGGDEAALKKVGWFNGNSNSQTQPVGQLPPNAWGLFDVHGNVWEWCQDWHANYHTSDVEDYICNNTSESRVFRGGSWYDGPPMCRAAYRFCGAPGGRYNNLGCRVVLGLD